MSLPLGKSVSPDLPPLLPTPIDVRAESLPSIGSAPPKEVPIASQDSELSVESDYTGEPTGLTPKAEPMPVKTPPVVSHEASAGFEKSLTVEAEKSLTVEVDTSVPQASPQKPSVEVQRNLVVEAVPSMPSESPRKPTVEANTSITVEAEKSPEKTSAPPQVDIAEEAKKFVETLYHLNELTGETAAPLFETSEKTVAPAPEQSIPTKAPTNETTTWEYDARPIVLKSPMKPSANSFVEPMSAKSTLTHSELQMTPSQESLEAIRFTAASVQAAESPRGVPIAVEVASIAEADKEVIEQIETAKSQESPEKAVSPHKVSTPVKDTQKASQEIFSQSPKVTFAATQPASNLLEKTPEKPPVEERPRPVQRSPRSARKSPRSAEKSTPSTKKSEDEPKPDSLARKTRGREVFLRPDDAAVFQLIKQHQKALKKNSPSPRKRNSMASPSPRKSSGEAVSTPAKSTPSKKEPSPKKARKETKVTKKQAVAPAKRKADTVQKATKKPKVSPPKRQPAKQPAAPKAKSAKQPVVPKAKPAKQPAKKAVKPPAEPQKARGKK